MDEPSSDLPDATASPAPHADGGTAAPDAALPGIATAEAEAEAALLSELEQDLAAVEEAMATLDRIAGDGSGGDAAANQIATVVSAARFPDGAVVTEVDLTTAAPSPSPSPDPTGTSAPVAAPGPFESPAPAATPDPGPTPAPSTAPDPRPSGPDPFGHR